MNDPLPIFSYEPAPDDFVWTFGGAPPKATVVPGTVLELVRKSWLPGRSVTTDTHEQLKVLGVRYLDQVEVEKK